MENTKSRLYFACDYMEGAHPSIMKKLLETNLEKTVGYGKDCAGCGVWILGKI